MRTTLLAYVAGPALCALASCQTSKTDEKSAFGTCATASETVRTVSNVKGTLIYNQQTQEYRLMAPQPGTVDVVDVGVVCGPLPAFWQGEGRKVVFSGTYKAYKDAPSGPAGYTFYHLELSKLTAE